MPELSQGSDLPEFDSQPNNEQDPLSTEQILCKDIQHSDYERDRVDVVLEWVEKRAKVAIIANPNGHGVASAEATRRYLSKHGISCEVIVGSPVVTIEPVSTYPKTFWTETLTALTPHIAKADAVLFLGIPLDIHNRDIAEISIEKLSIEIGKQNSVTPLNQIVFLDFHPNDFRLSHKYVRSLYVSGFDRCSLAPKGDPFVSLAIASMQNSPLRSGDRLHRLAEILDWAVRPVGRKPKDQVAAETWQRESQQRLLRVRDGLAAQGLAYLDTLEDAFTPYYLTGRVHARLGRAGIVDSNDLKGSHSVYKTLGAIAVEQNLDYCFALRAIGNGLLDQKIEISVVTNPDGRTKPIAKVMTEVLGAGAWEYCRCKGTEEAFSALLPPRQAAFLFCRLLEAVSGEEVAPLNNVNALAIFGPPNSGKSSLSDQLKKLLDGLFGVSVDVTDLDSFAPTPSSYLSAIGELRRLEREAGQGNVPQEVLEEAKATVRSEEQLRAELKKLDPHQLADSLVTSIRQEDPSLVRSLKIFDFPAGRKSAEGMEYLDKYNSEILRVLLEEYPDLRVILVSATLAELTRLTKQFNQLEHSSIDSPLNVARFLSSLNSSEQRISSDNSDVQYISHLERGSSELLQNPALLFLAARLAQGLEERRADLVIERIQDEARRLRETLSDHQISVEVGGPLVAGFYSLYGLVPHEAPGACINVVEADFNVSVSSSLSDREYAELSSQIAKNLGIPPSLVFEERRDRARGNDGYWEGVGTIFDDRLEAQIEVSLRVRRGDSYRSIYKLAPEVLPSEVLSSAKLWYEQFLRYGNIDAARALKAGLRTMIIDQAIVQGKLQPCEPAPPRLDNTFISDALSQALANVQTLSRTTKGEGNTEAHADKPALLLSGDALQKRAEANYLQLLYEILQEPAKLNNPDDVRALFNTLYVKVNTGLFSTAGSQWRTWPTLYNPVHPDHIRGELDRFYQEFFEMWSGLRAQAPTLSGEERLESVASLAAFMEYEWNHRIHAVRDGVCRTSCAVTALIFANFGVPQPRLQISYEGENPDKNSRKLYYAAFDSAEAVSQQALREGKSRNEARWKGIKHFAKWYRNNLIVDLESS